MKSNLAVQPHIVIVNKWWSHEALLRHQQASGLCVFTVHMIPCWPAAFLDNHAVTNNDAHSKNDIFSIFNQSQHWVTSHPLSYDESRKHVLLAALKSHRRGWRREIQEATVSLAAAKELSVDAALSHFHTERRTKKTNRYWRIFSVENLFLLHSRVFI